MGRLVVRKAGAAIPMQPSSIARMLSALGVLVLMAFLLLGGEGEAGASLVETETSAAISDPPSAPPPGGSGRVAVDCAAAVAGIQSACAYPAEATFDVEIHVTQAPEEGYFGFQTKLRWEAALVYLASDNPAQEALWPECDLSLRRDNQPQGDPSLLFGCAPFPALSEGATDTGAVLRFRLRCQQEGSTPLLLVPRQGDPQGGTYFLDSRLAALDPGLTSAQVTCGSPPPCPPGGCSTPAPTSAPLPDATAPPAPTLTTTPQQAPPPPTPGPTSIATATPQPTALPPTPAPTATPQPTSTPPPPPDECERGVQGLLYVRVYPGIAEERAREIIEGEGTSIVGQYANFPGVYAVEVPVGEEQEFVARFLAYEEVVWAWTCDRNYGIIILPDGAPTMVPTPTPTATPTPTSGAATGCLDGPC